MHFHGVPIGRFVASRLLWASRTSRLVTIQADGYKLRFHPSSVSAAMFCNPTFFREEETLLQRLLHPGDCFVDVGANVGTLSLAAARIVGEQGRVVAIEAHPKIARYLTDNVALNGFTNVQVIHSAAGKDNTHVYLSDRRSDDQNAVGEVGIRVPMRRLDDLIAPRKVRLLKIDVEGLEYMVLQGAKRLLRHTDFVQFESWEVRSRKYGYSTQDVIHLLEGCGFHVDVPKGYASEKYENLLARRAER